MTSGSRCADALSEFDWDLVTFVVRWARYGGPDPEEVLPNFGMTCARLRERLGQIVEYTDRHPHRLTAAQKELVARAERWLSTLDAGQSNGTAADGADLLEVQGQPTLRRGIWRWQ
ncbi:hypothetical protein [Mycolicibacterium nivoides]|uniref:hypothetical protein n=1 Tax=Mycolicibacterium nivoides TaxID=2487344 RepID=UPI003C2C1AB3